MTQKNNSNNENLLCTGGGSSSVHSVICKVAFFQTDSTFLFVSLSLGVCTTVLFLSTLSLCGLGDCERQ